MDNKTFCIETLIEELTTDGQEKLSPQKLQMLAEYCKTKINNNEAFRYLWRLVYHRLRENHSQIRYSAFLIIDYLFERSHFFRKLICKNFDSLFELCLGIKSVSSKPSTSMIQTPNLDLQPKVWSKKLQTKMLKCFQCWHRKFGTHYSLLKTKYQFLVDLKIIETSNNSPSSSFTNSSHTVLRKMPELIKKFDDLEHEINFLILQIDSCFELLIPKISLIEEKPTNLEKLNEEKLNFRPMQGLSFNIILSSKIDLTRDSSNTDLINVLQELCKELKIFDQKLKHFDLKFRKFFYNNNEIRNRIQTLKIKIMSIINKENDINITNLTEDADNKELKESDDDDFEEVIEKEDQILMAIIEGQKHENKVTENSSNQCLALLPSGRRCPRRDKINCPFHGKIVPRDDQGLPLDPELKKKELEIKYQKESNEWKDPKYLKLLEEQFGVNLQHNKSKKKKRYPNLVDLKELNSTPKKRLESKLKKLKKNINLC